MKTSLSHLCIVWAGVANLGQAPNQALDQTVHKPFTSFEQHILKDRPSPINVGWSVFFTLIGTVFSLAFIWWIALIDYFLLKYTAQAGSNLPENFFAHIGVAIFFRKEWFKTYYWTTYTAALLLASCIGFINSYLVIYLCLKMGWRSILRTNIVGGVLNSVFVFLIFCVLNKGLITFFSKPNTEQIYCLLLALSLSIGVGFIQFLGVWEVYRFLYEKFPNGRLLSDPRVTALLHLASGNLFQKKAAWQAT